MNKIENFLAKGARPDKMKQFENMTVGKSKEEIRQIEMEMLEPEPIPLYIGEERRYIVNSEHTVKFIFANQEEMDFFGKHIPIASYIEKSVTDLKMVFDLLHEIENGSILYNKKSGTFQLVPKTDKIKGEISNVVEPAKSETIPAPENEVKTGGFRRFLRRGQSA